MNYVGSEYFRVLCSDRFDIIRLSNSVLDSIYFIFPNCNVFRSFQWRLLYKNNCLIQLKMWSWWDEFFLHKNAHLNWNCRSFPNNFASHFNTAQVFATGGNSDFFFHCLPYFWHFSRLIAWSSSMKKVRIILAMM